MEVYLAREVFFQTMFDFFFFITPCHPELDSGSHSFFQNALIHFFLITSLFLLFHKNYYYITKEKEPTQSPKPAVFLPLKHIPLLYLELLIICFFIIVSF